MSNILLKTFVTLISLIMWTHAMDDKIDFKLAEQNYIQDIPALYSVTKQKIYPSNTPNQIANPSLFIINKEDQNKPQRAQPQQTNQLQKTSGENTYQKIQKNQPQYNTENMEKESTVHPNSNQIEFQDEKNMQLDFKINQQFKTPQIDEDPLIVLKQFQDAVNPPSNLHSQTPQNHNQQTHNQQKPQTSQPNQHYNPTKQPSIPNSAVINENNRVDMGQNNILRYFGYGFFIVAFLIVIFNADIKPMRKQRKYEPLQSNSDMPHGFEAEEMMSQEIQHD